MDSLEYVRLVNQAPVRYIGTEVSIEELQTALRDAIKTLSALEHVNHLLFNNDKIKRKGHFNNCASVPSTMGEYDNSARTISAILNISRNCLGLLAEFDYCLKGRAFDKPVLIGSCRDIFQSLAIIAEQTNRSFEEMQIASFEFLKYKHPDVYKAKSRQRETSLMDLVNHE